MIYFNKDILKIFSAIIFILCSCTTKQKSETFTDPKIELQINIKDKNRLIYYDNLGNINYLVNGKNEILIENNNDNLQVIDLKFNISYILKKCDSLNIIDSLSYIKLISTSKSRNKELEFPVFFFKTFDLKTYKQWSFQKAYLDDSLLKNPSKREARFFQEIEQKALFIENYCKEHKLSNSFLQQENDIISSNIMERRLLAGNKLNKISYSYQTEIKDITKSNFNAKKMHLVSYRNSIIFYYLFFIKQDRKISFKHILDNFDLECRDFLVSTIILNAEKDDSYKLTKSEFNTFISEFNTNIKNPYYLDKISSFLEKKSKISKHIEIENDLNQKVELQNIFNKSKFTYIDFWASWCAPCIAEMEYYKKNHMNNNPKINYIFISIDEDLSSWKVAMKRLNLKISSSFRAVNGLELNLLKRYNIIYIPHYMIVDSSGNIINSDAPRPSDPKIRQIFDGLLKER